VNLTVQNKDLAQGMPLPAFWLMESATHGDGNRCLLAKGQKKNKEKGAKNKAQSKQQRTVC
jgi:hypothetical protein